MATASPLTYEGALSLLGRHSPAAIEVLERVAGAGILLGAIAVPGALGLVDGKQEAGRLLRDLTGAAAARLRGTHGHERHELVAAAHTTVALSALFDALQEGIGPSFAALEVTDREKLQLASAPGVIVTQAEWIGQLATADLPLPGPAAGFEENLVTALEPRVSELAGAAMAFFEGLQAWNGFPFDSPAILRRVTDRWKALYRDAYLRLATEAPEFFVWASLGEHAATRTELRQADARLLELLEGASAAMGQLHDVLAAHGPAMPAGRDSLRAKLARAAAAVLDQPLLRSSGLPPGLTFPTVAEGFVTPRFRMAVATPEVSTKLSQEQWWNSRPMHDGLDRFLAAHLAHPDASRRPLIVLGHPGAGKSLLADILAARLPVGRYAVVPVQLRRVGAGDRLLTQLETALRDTLHEQVSWGRLADECGDLTRVIVLDGFDELVQATGTVQSGYLAEVSRFQEQESALGRSVAVVITSRTIVVDRARIPDGSLVVKLEEFSDEQIDLWLTAWNRANARSRGFRALTAVEALRHGDLARQPLLLTLLAVYHADPSAARLTGDGTLSTAALYRSLMGHFVHRQVADKPERPPATEQVARDAGDLRWRLSIAAFGMFNRQRQHVLEEDLERDLEVFLGRRQQNAYEFDSAVGQAHRTVAGFFFVHVARVDEYTDHARRTYEFLHATFGEFLIAERALLLLGGYARALHMHESEPSVHEAPDDSLLRALLSYQPLTWRRPILEFGRSLAAELPERDQQNMVRAVRSLLARARSRAFGRYAAYQPAPPDVVTACAAFTANLVILVVLLAREPLTIDSLSPGGTTSANWTRAMSRLWDAGLETEARDSLSAAVRGTGSLETSGEPPWLELR